MNDERRPQPVPDFGQTVEEMHQGLPKGAEVGRTTAKVLCSHVNDAKPHLSRQYPVVKVRGKTVICGQSQYQLQSGTFAPPFRCPGCPDRVRYLDMDALRARIFTPHAGVLLLEADDVSRPRVEEVDSDPEL